jgi:hypothetical protein
MFALAFEDRYRVLLVRFSGIHVPEDISELEWAATEIVAWDGPMHGLLLDYTSVEAVAVPHSFIAYRARLPQISSGYERVMVAPNPELYELAHAYARLQRDFGNPEPRVVLSLWDAYQLLGLDKPDFQDIR